MTFWNAVSAVLFPGYPYSPDQYGTMSPWRYRLMLAVHERAAGSPQKRSLFPPLRIDLLSLSGALRRGRRK